MTLRRATLEINGESRRLETSARTAVELIREDLALTGTKLVCGTGSCGACVVHVAGVPVASCLLPVEAIEGSPVTTIEGLADDDLHPVQRAFVARDGLQCGFCTPGFVMEAAAFHDSWRAEHGTRRPSREQVARALAGHLCRCGAYQGIYAAVQEACQGTFDSGPPSGHRVEAVDKVTGRARYTVDIRIPGMLHGRMIRSPLAHADLVHVDSSEAMAMAGVEAFVLFPPSDGRVRYVGEAYAAVAATDERLARAAADSVVSHFVERRPVIGIDAALADGAPNLHARGWTPPSSSEASPLPNVHRGNLRGPLSALSSHRFRARRAVADAAGSDLLVDHRWEFPAQIHTAFEPHACVANWTDDGLEVYVSTQAVSALRVALAKRFGLDIERVVVRAEHVGGAFGAKQGLNEETIAAVELSRAAGRPVRLVFDRHEELEVAGYRPGARVDLALAGDSDGGLPAFTTTSHADGGASAGQVIALFHRFAYPGSPRSLLDYDVLTNAPPGRAMRAPGGPLAFTALEGAVDEYAVRLDRDPLDLRRSWGAAGLLPALYEWVEDRPLWRRRPPTGSGRFRRGVGLAFGFWVYFYDPHTAVEVASSASGLVVKTASQDMGNGTRTALAASVAGVFGVDPGFVTAEVGMSGPFWGPASAGSRTTTSIVPAAAAAAAVLVRRLTDGARSTLGLDGAEATSGGLTHAGEFIPWSEIVGRLEPMSASTGRPSDGRRPLTPFSIEGLRLGQGLTRSAHIVEVEVDSRLGRIRPLQVDSALAVGRIHVPELARSQVHGGVIQGIGYSLYEERLLDPASGLNITTNLDQYRLPGIAEMPESTVEFIEEGFEHSASGSAGLSELATAAVPAAVANAVSRAAGHRFTRLPIRPEHIVGVLG